MRALVTRTKQNILKSHAARAVTTNMNMLTSTVIVVAAVTDTIIMNTIMNITVSAAVTVITITAPMITNTAKNTLTAGAISITAPLKTAWIPTGT